jgi:hypothetical protein
VKESCLCRPSFGSLKTAEEVAKVVRITAERILQLSRGQMLPPHFRIDGRKYAESGAEGQNRTVDTSLFRAVLCQLSYLGTEGSQSFSAGWFPYLRDQPTPRASYQGHISDFHIFCTCASFFSPYYLLWVSRASQATHRALMTHGSRPGVMNRQFGQGACGKRGQTGVVRK